MVLVSRLTEGFIVKHILFTVGLLGLLVAPLAWSTDWQSAPEVSVLNFAPSYEGLPINGEFSEFSVSYTTGKDGQPKALTVSVLVASADLGNRDLNTEIRAADWFNIADFPKAIFSCQEFTQDEKGNVLAHGDLQIKGYSRPVTVPFSWQTSSTGQALMKGDLALGRNHFFIGSDEWASGNQIGLAVKVQFDVVLNSVNASL